MLCIYYPKGQPNQNYHKGEIVEAIIVKASIKGRVIEWLYEGEDEASTLKKAKQVLKKQGLKFITYRYA